MSQSTMQLPQRRKQATYGRSARTAKTWGLMTADEKEEERQSAISPRSERTTPVKERHLQRGGAVAPLEKIAKASPKKQDLWDFPSSVEETKRSAPTSRAALPKPSTPKLRIAQRTKDTEQPLASWEQKESAASPLRDRRGNKDEHGPLASPVRRDSYTNDRKGHKLSPKVDDAVKQNNHAGKASVVAPGTSVDARESSAAARLLAKKKATNGTHSVQRENIKTSSTKRLGAEIDAGAPAAQRKRLRPGLEDGLGVNGMEDSPDENHDKKGTLSRDQSGLVTIDSRTDSATWEKISRVSATADQRKQHTHGMPPETRRVMSPRKQDSAPARLMSMASPSSPPTSPVPGSGPTTPMASKNLSRRYSRDTTASPVTSSDAPKTSQETSPAPQANMTPKQVKLWSQLLPTQGSEASPSVLPIAELDIRSARRSVGTARDVSLVKSKSDVGRRKPKLVDRLKAMAQESDDDLEMDTNERAGLRSESQSESTFGANPPPPSLSQQSVSNPPSQRPPANRGPSKITYARTRSHLEDSFDQDLLLNLDSGSMRSPQGGLRTPRKHKPVQSSSWDFEESDDDGERKTQQFRSIHELRANGDNVRFMNDMSSLLEDISDHKFSARSRRRSALIDLALRLADKSFVQKFCRQSYEQQLVAECKETPDDVADFALAGAFVILMAGDAPQQVFMAMKDGGVLAWLGRLLDSTDDAPRLARAVSNNMSKSAQGTLVEFANKLLEMESVWGSHQPASLHLRSLALKAYDLLVSRLRLSGDTSELVNDETLTKITPSHSSIEDLQSGVVPCDVALSISVLEALASPAHTPAWPKDVTERVIRVLISPALSHSESRHTYFLNLRLCHKLTNDTEHNREAFSNPAVLTHLLCAVNSGFEKQKILLKESGGEDSTLDDAGLGDAAKLDLDILLLEMGLLIVITEHTPVHGAYRIGSGNRNTLASLTKIFQQGRQRTDDADTVAAGVTNVAFGYLSIVLANVCQDDTAREVIAANLPRGTLAVLVEAVEEFVMYNQKVDMANLEGGASGADVWDAFTETLKGVLKRLKEVAGDAMILD